MPGIPVKDDQCESIGIRSYNGWDERGLRQSMKVCKCDGHGKVDRALVKSRFRRCVDPLDLQACNAAFTSLCIIGLSENGEESIENTVALCPNCHRKMHILNLQSEGRFLLPEGQHI
jgi:hypothetical protein